MASVDLRGIAKSFGAVKVLESIDLSIKDGERVALLGPSGCGKSTLIRIVAGLETPDRGEVRLGERMVFGPKIALPPEERKLGMVFQSYAVWPHRTVRQNVAYPLKVRGAKEIDREVDRAIDLVRLTGLGERYPHELSGGQQQRVALARALVAKPEVLLLDEPLSNLDARLREEMRGEIASLAGNLGITVLWVTHDQSEALSTADRVAVMRTGKIVQLAAPEEIYRAPADLYVAMTVGAVNAIEVRALSDGTVEAAGGIRAKIPGKSGDPARFVLAVRPEQILLDDQGELALTVESRAFLGDRVDLTLRGEGITLRAAAAARNAPAVGATVRVRLLDPQLLEK